jgi:hypothetical protein
MAAITGIGRTFGVGTVNIAPAATIGALNVAQLANPGDLGKVFESEGKWYRVVKFDNGTGNVAAAVGNAAYWYDRDDFVVTSDYSDSEGEPNNVAGGFTAVVTDGNYCVVQMGGTQTSVNVESSAAAGDQLSGSSTDGRLAKTAAGTACVNLCVAICLSAESSNTATVQWLPGALMI